MIMMDGVHPDMDTCALIDYKGLYQFHFHSKACVSQYDQEIECIKHTNFTRKLKTDIQASTEFTVLSHIGVYWLKKRSQYC